MDKNYEKSDNTVLLNPEQNSLSGRVSQELQEGMGEIIAIDGDFDFDGYEVVRREFFAHTFEPSVTFNNYKMYVNMACLRQLPDVGFVQCLVNPEAKILAFRSASENNRDAFAWCNAGGGKRKPKQISCRVFCHKIAEFMNWNPNCRYKLLGKLIHANGEFIVAFDLSSFEMYKRVSKDGEKPRNSRTPYFPEEWKNQFGLPYKEHQRTMKIDTFDGYTIYSVRENAYSDQSSVNAPEIRTNDSLPMAQF